MTLPLIAALVYLLLSVRVMADVRLEISEARKGMQILLHAWGVSFCIDRPLELRLQGRDMGRKGRRFKALWPMICAALRAIRWGQTDVDVRLGLSEASYTALIAGAGRSALTSLQAMLGQRFPCRMRVEPDFDMRCFALTARCIFSAAPGNIMFAVARAAVKKTQREGFSWLSIPLKA